MWNEDQFFKDFSDSMDKIKPDPSFVKELKSLANEDASLSQRTRSKKHQYIKYTQIAALVLLFLSIGGIGVHTLLSDSDNSSIADTSIHGNQGADSTTGTITGTIENQNAIPDSILSMVESKDTILTDSDGNVVSEEERDELLTTLKKCVKTDQTPDPSTASQIYYCEGEDTLKISVYSSYIEINQVLYRIP